MILSSVMKHVREQNWFAVGVDFLIVVIGVYIGIQVSNWNEQRKSQAELGASLEDLAQEVSNTATMRENHLQFQRGTLQGYSFMLDLLEGVELDDDKRRLAYSALTRGFPPPSPSRYETLYGLQSTGRLRDVSSERLRGALGELLSQDRLYSHYSDYWIRGVSAPPFSTAIVSYGLSPPGEDGRRDTRVTEFDLELARDDPDFRTRVTQMYTLWEVVTFSNEASLRMDRLILEILESEGFIPSGYWFEENLERIMPGSKIRTGKAE